MSLFKRYSLRKVGMLLILFVAGIAPIVSISHGAGQTIPIADHVFLPIISRPLEPTATNTPRPTATAIPATNTPVPTATALPVATNTPQPTATTALLFICSSDTYNCSDFNTQAEAQNVFNYCAVRGFGDIHKLDQNNDGEACESLP